MKDIFSPRGLALGGMVAALYIVLTAPFAQFTMGPIQFRVAEALTVLPIIMPQSILGVFIGCLLANIFAGAHILDIVGGSLITLVAAILTYYFRGSKLAYSFPIVLNAIFIPMILYYAFAVPFLPTVLSIFISQAIIILGLGVPLIAVLKRRIKNWQ
ncbi:QueT transporter family protein [Proteinivorax hydrogeniformans]|uniref:QueT transporter family protein n=1 Tax=Proteinivorax hydrogeniformans TaxID=1826727 RepID=A0AAU8HUV7_9FIRM